MWAGIVNLEVDGWLVGVEYDTDETATAIRESCRRWLADDTRRVDAAFGVRTAPVGLRRRRVGLVHHGTPVRLRTPDLASAAEALAAIVADMTSEPSEREVSLPLRIFRRDDRAVLVDVPPATDIDDRPLRKRDITEVPVWRSTVDVRAGTVRCGPSGVPLAGVVITTAAAGPSFDDHRRHLWSLADGDRRGWAALLDRWDASMVVRTDDATADIRRLLG